MADYTEVQINAPIYLTLLQVEPPPPRAFDTVYLNDKPAPRFVSVCMGVYQENTRGGAVAYICEDAEAENPVWQRVAMELCSWQSGHLVANLWATLKFEVPPGWYYKAEKVYDPKIYEWIEQDLYAIKG